MNQMDIDINKIETEEVSDLNAWKKKVLDVMPDSTRFYTYKENGHEIEISPKLVDNGRGLMLCAYHKWHPKEFFYGKIKRFAHDKVSGYYSVAVEFDSWAYPDQRKTLDAPDKKYWDKLISETNG